MVLTRYSTAARFFVYNYLLLRYTEATRVGDPPRPLGLVYLLFIKIPNYILPGIGVTANPD